MSTAADKGLWFYHVSYQHPIINGLTYGDTSMWIRWRIDNDDKLREVREKLNEMADDRSPRRIGDVIITGITLLVGPEMAERDEKISQ